MNLTPYFFYFFHAGSGADFAQAARAATRELRDTVNRCRAV